MTTIKPILVSTLLKTLNIVNRYTQYIGQYIAYSVHTQYIKVRDRARRSRPTSGTLSNFPTSLLPYTGAQRTPGTGALALYREQGEQNNKTQILNRSNVDMISPSHLVSTMGTVLTRGTGSQILTYILNVYTIIVQGIKVLTRELGPGTNYHIAYKPHIQDICFNGIGALTALCSLIHGFVWACVGRFRGGGVPVFGRLRTENGLVAVPTPAQNFLGFVGSVSTRKFVGQFPQPVSTFHISTGRAI